MPIDFADMDSVLARVTAVARQRQFFQIATVNLDFLVHSARDEEVHTILADTDMNLPDGAPLVWAGRLLGLREARRVAGADLVPGLVAAAARANLRVFLLGGERGSAAEAASRLGAVHPNLRVEAYEPPRAALEDMDDEVLLGYIDDFQPHILLVALGHPKQDKWIHRHRESLPMVAIGVGCSLDLIAGRRSRAPRWMQRAGLEWTYRMLHDPRRLGRRYLTDGFWMVRTLVPWVVAERLGGQAVSSC